ncbi:MAG: DNA polymerase III subunit delta [Gaiellaceae bacterium]
MAADLQPVYLIVGGDRPKIHRALQRLRARVAEESVEVLSARDTSGEEAVAACNALGLFGAGGRLVIVEEAERWKAADVKSIAAYLASPAPETVLALTGELKAESPLGKACAKGGEVLAYDVPRGKLPEWVAARFEALGAAADREACRALIEVVGDDLHALATEAEKLAAWAGGDAIDARTVQQLVPHLADTPPWDLTDAWGRRDVPAALAAVEAALDRSGEARSTTLSRLVGSMNGHVALVRACQRFQAEGLSPQAAAARLGKRPFPVQKAFAQASNFTVDELRDAVVRLAQLDHALKGGSRLAGDLELERALVDITRPAEPAPARS